VACGRPSPRAWTCAGCRWLDEQELQRAREWDEIDPDRNDLASSRELPWTVQGLLSMEAAYQEALSPEAIQAEAPRARATAARVLTRGRKAAHTRARRAADRKRAAWWAAERERAAQAAREARDAAFWRASILAQPAADGGSPLWGPSLPPMMEPPPGTAVFRHAIAESGATCATVDGAPRCSCGFYRMTWTATLDIV
jgi:hypothetical protein